MKTSRNFSTLIKPRVYPSSPCFGSGPCKKFPGFSLHNLSENLLGRSHRSKEGKKALYDSIEKTKQLLQLPEGYKCGIVPGSDTGAFEMAMWNLLGPLPVDVFYWEAFGKGWYKDITEQLRLPNVQGYTANYGEIPDLDRANNKHDVIFTWNGTTSGVCVPNADWIDQNRQGLVFCDATSAAFAMDIKWEKLDVCTFSWQKVLGGEGAHGMLILSPRAVERLKVFTPSSRPIPKLFQLKNYEGKMQERIFDGSTVNTPSMLCVEDYLCVLKWAETYGVKGLIQKSKENLQVIEEFVAQNNPWIKFLCKENAIRSNTSVCLCVDLPKEKIKEMTQLLAHEKVAYDINSYRDAPTGIRIWCGATVDKEDLQILMKWLKWAYFKVQNTERGNESISILQNN